MNNYLLAIVCVLLLSRFTLMMIDVLVGNAMLGLVLVFATLVLFFRLELGAVDYITKPINPGVVLARVHNHLELKLARQKLQTQNKQLKKMMQMREQLSHMVVHDIRSPIASILGACELVLLEGINSNGKIAAFQQGRKVYTHPNM